MKPADHDDRPDPDLLLKAVQREEEQGRRGKLKVFLGLAAGVGKTYAMLSAAQELKARGADVAAGLVETHGRVETEALLQGLVVVPRKKISYRNVELTELDLDQVLARKPQIVLVDEAAHTNAPGCRHTKRYQDIFELLDAGIDVYTTLNIQHLESLADTVREITGIKVAETTPDSLIDRAEEVVLVDLAPEELLKRLREGKVYGQERAARAAENFFQVGNLTALRELSLRLVAQRVNRDLRDYQQTHRISETWKTSHRLMVALYASPYSELMIRWTRRMAASLDAPWFGAYVETDVPLAERERQLLSKNFALAKELGGEIIQTVDHDAVAGLLRLARENQVTQLVIGKSRRGFWHNLKRGGALTNRLLKESGNIDVYVVSGELAPEQALPDQLDQDSFPVPWGKFLAAAIAPLLIGGLGYALAPLLGYRSVGLLFLLGVCLLGLRVGRGPVLVAALLSGLIWNFFFIPPAFTFAISEPEDYMMFGLFLVTAMIIGHLTSRLRNNEKQTRLREARVTALYQLTRDISSAKTMDKVLTGAVEHLGKIFEAEVAVLVRRPEGELVPHTGNTFIPDAKEKTVAEWVAQNSRPAGRFTDTLSSAQAFYLPLVAAQGTVGVLGLSPRHERQASPELMTLAETFARQLAVGIEREQLNERARHTQVVEESERLYKTILNSVSHELKTPLAAIEGSAGALLDPMVAGNRESVQELALTIREASQRLDRLVVNLLGMTRLEAGVVPLKRQPGDVSDLISATLRQLEPEMSEHPLSLELADNLPLVPFDFLMMEQALANILRNAAVHTPPGAPVKISARAHADRLVIEVVDRGPGLPPENPERVFDKFWRGQPSKSGGTGLGLAIAKGWVEAHGGTIQARNHPEGGAWFTLSLPLEVTHER